MWRHYYDPHDPYFEVPGYPASDDDFQKYRAIVRSVDHEIKRFAGAEGVGDVEQTILGYADPGKSSGSTVDGFTVKPCMKK